MQKADVSSTRSTFIEKYISVWVDHRQFLVLLLLERLRTKKYAGTVLKSSIKIFNKKLNICSILVFSRLKKQHFINSFDVSKVVKIWLIAILNSLEIQNRIVVPLSNFNFSIYLCRQNQEKQEIADNEPETKKKLYKRIH